MTFSRTFTLSVSALALIAGTATADVTGTQIWQDWKDYYAGFGYTASGTETQNGDTLTVSDADMSVVLPNDEGTMSFGFGTLQFVNNSDGTVSIILPEQMPINFDMAPASGAPVKGEMMLINTGTNMVVSGDADNQTYTYTAQSVAIEMGDFAAEGVEMPEDAIDINFMMNNISLVTRMTQGNMRGYDQTMSADDLVYSFAFKAPPQDGGGTGQFKGNLVGLTSGAKGVFPNNPNATTDLSKLIEDGFNVDGTFAFTNGNGSFQATSPEGNLNATTSSDGGDIQFSMGAGGLAYDVSQTNTKVDMTVPQFPLPISLEMAQSAFNLLMPVQTGEGEQDFAFGFTMGDFTISDAIWGIFDPAGQLPRDPATLALNLTGKAKMAVNIFAPESAALLEAGAPMGEVNSIDINKLTVRAVGAELTGGGAFAFDNKDMTTFDGIPRPEGAVDLRLTGANALIDTLINMGFVQQEQAMGARMMMGMFGVPDGDDALTSKIEVNEQGHVLANGQRIR